MSLEELGEIRVTSVSKRPEAAAEAASSIFVITHEDIVRSGLRRIPEILRLAPNLDVYQAGSSRYVVTARGLNGNPAAQNFSNKLLVLIDGRTVYTPLFSGVYWDMQDTPPEDIDRIEVISGPGATLWGANAVNGVINIITRKAADTQGAFLRVAGGGRGASADLHYGAPIGDKAAFRVYAETFRSGDSQDASGASQHDHWSKPQAGFRLDWAPSRKDALTLQGDLYSGSEAQPGAPSEGISGANLTGRWTRSWSNGGTTQIQAYYDRAHRGAEVNGDGFTVDTLDFDVTHTFPLGPRQEIVFGGGVRSSDYRIFGTPTLWFEPSKGTLQVADVFAQDTITLQPSLKLTLGVKVEDDPYIAPEALPSVRLAWVPIAPVTVWGAVSRAIRSPTPFDRDVVEQVGGAKFLIGGAAFQPEKLVAYELGTRVQIGSRANLSVTGFYNVYEDLRSIELAPAGFLPLRWGNRLKGDTYGVEAWGAYQVGPGWRLTGSFKALEHDFGFVPGASRLLGAGQTADDPEFQATLGSSIDLGKRITLDGMLRYVDALPDPHVPSYVELNGRLGWKISERYVLSVAARNLLHDRHQEYAQGAFIPRSVFAELTCRF